MKTILHKAATRGHANHGWLDTYHTFSFADYYDANRVRFGVLRVLNDDTVAGGGGFPAHPHENMEIITIPLEGALSHKDSMGYAENINAGDIQVMSAGKGIYHSEFNKNSDKPVKFLQIWVFPDKRDVEPRYEQITLDQVKDKNKLQQILSPYPAVNGSLWIHQQAWFSIGAFDKDMQTDYTIKRTENGVYAFVIQGYFTINGERLAPRDGLGVWDTQTLHITADSPDARILLMDVPM